MLLERVSDGARILDVPLSHKTIQGAGCRNLLVSVGMDPFSMIAFDLKTGSRNTLPLEEEPSSVCISVSCQLVAIGTRKGWSLFYVHF